MKWYHYLICGIIILLGIFFGIKLYQEIRAESYVNGSIDISNQFSQETLNYSNSAVSFYQDEKGYYFSVDTLVIDNFNGQENEYQLFLNDYILYDSEYSAGSIISRINIDFYDVDGNVEKSTSMGMSIYFLDDRTTITLRTSDLSSATYLEKYFVNNGCKINLVEIL